MKQELEVLLIMVSVNKVTEIFPCNAKHHIFVQFKMCHPFSTHLYKDPHAAYID